MTHAGVGLDDIDRVFVHELVADGLSVTFQEADAEIKAAEKSGFKVNPQLKEDLKKAAARR